MRLKSVIILSGLCLIITFGIFQGYIASFTYHACDIPNINNIYKNIERDLRLQDKSSIEEKYNCSIIMKSDTDYSDELYSAIDKGNVIVDYLDGDKLLGKVIFTENSDSLVDLKKSLSIALWIVFGITITVIYGASYVIYIRILRPFRVLKHFADNIAVGNLEVPLTMDRSNYFGAFTESFDMMREELKKAKEGECQANISKKELVAGLSHDIKNPVATIKALCEVLDIRLKDEELLPKIHTIYQKADVIDKLISNMFSATMEELEALKIEPHEEYSTIIIPMIEEVNHYGLITIKNEIPGCLIYCDKLRLNQVIDNIINNSYKYANTNITVTFCEEEKYITAQIRDYGNNINEDELPLICEKYYRGENATSQSGSGLGLYLANQFMKGMKGELRCHIDNGFVVTLSIRKAF